MGGAYRMNTLIVVAVSVLGCISTFLVGYAAGLAYAVETLKTEGEKDE